MNITLSFNELSDYLAPKYKVRPDFSFVDEKTIDIAYKHNRFIPAAHLQLRMESVSNEAIILSYECSAPMALLIAGAAHLENKIPAGISINADKKAIQIQPLKIEPLKKPLSHIDLKEVVFTSNALQAVVSLL